MSKLFRFLSYTVVLSALVLFGILADSPASNAKSRRPTQVKVERGAGIGIGTLCGGAITALGRQPNEEDAIIEGYEAALATIQSVPTKISAGEFSEAVGMIGAAFVDAIARQPSEAEALSALADRCVEDLMSLL